MAQIDKPNLHFNTLTWTGDGSGSRNITGVGFQPDWVWGKCRNTTVSHAVYDSVRGASKLINTNATSAEGTNAALSAFISDGFTVNSDSYLNGNSNTYVAWNWKANGTGSSNTDGTINSTVSANTTAGFSIVSYTANATAGATVGHGLGAVPKMIIVKSRTSVDSWIVYHSGNTSAPETDYLSLNTTDATADDAIWNDTAPTSSVFSLGTNAPVNGSGKNLIAYCFAEKKGFSKFGSYTGNGNNDGTFIYTGFKPAWVMIKRSNSSGEGWHIYDNKRNTFNLVTQILTANNSNQEATGSAGGDVIDMLSQGFKCRGTHGAINGSSNTYIYMAFAENPIVGSNDIPTTAR